MRFQVKHKSSLHLLALVIQFLGSFPADTKSNFRSRADFPDEQEHVFNDQELLQAGFQVPGLESKEWPSLLEGIAAYPVQYGHAEILITLPLSFGIDWAEMETNVALLYCGKMPSVCIQHDWTTQKNIGLILRKATK